MATMTFFSPKSFLFRIADMFQKPATNVQEWNETQEEINEMPKENTNHVIKPKTKLNVNLSDLKLISTALLQYRRTLAKQGLNEKAEEIARIDRQFYELISDLENIDED